MIKGDNRASSLMRTKHRAISAWSDIIPMRIESSRSDWYSFLRYLLIFISDESWQDFSSSSSPSLSLSRDGTSSWSQTNSCVATCSMHVFRARRLESTSMVGKEILSVFACRSMITAERDRSWHKKPESLRDWLRRTYLYSVVWSSWKSLLVDRIWFVPRMFDIVRCFHSIAANHSFPTLSIDPLRRETNRRIWDLVEWLTKRSHLSSMERTVTEFQLY